MIWRTPSEDELRQAVARIRAADAAIDEARAMLVRQRLVKRQIIRDLYVAGWNYTRIAKELGISPQRVRAIANDEP